MPGTSGQAVDVARMLNSAIEMGIEDVGIMDVIQDYFTGKLLHVTRPSHCCLNYCIGMSDTPE